MSVHAAASARIQHRTQFLCPSPKPCGRGPFADAAFVCRPGAQHILRDEVGTILTNLQKSATKAGTKAKLFPYPPMRLDVWNFEQSSHQVWSGMASPGCNGVFFLTSFPGAPLANVQFDQFARVPCGQLRVNESNVNQMRASLVRHPPSHRHLVSCCLFFQLGHYTLTPPSKLAFLPFVRPSASVSVSISVLSRFP